MNWFVCVVGDCRGHDDILHAIHHGQEQLMATLADLTAVVDATAAAVNRIDTDFAALKEQLANLQPGVLTPEQQAALDAAVANLEASVSAINAADPAPEAEPTVDPTTTETPAEVPAEPVV